MHEGKAFPMWVSASTHKERERERERERKKERKKERERERERERGREGERGSLTPIHTHTYSLTLMRTFSPCCR